MSDGSTKAFLGILKKICDDGNEALVICPDNGGIYKYLSEKNPIAGVRVLQLPYTYNIYPFLKNPKDYLLFLPRLLKRKIKNHLAASKLSQICKEYQPDLIHSNTSVNDIGYLASKRNGVPHIWHIREKCSKDYLLVPRQKKMFYSPNNYKILITEFLRSYYDLENDETSTVIYDGPIETIGIPRLEDSRYFFYAGRINESKGVYDLLQAYSNYVREIGEGALMLKLAGKIDSGEEQRLFTIISELGLENKVELLGVQNNLSDYYSKATAVIVPSFYEGFGFILPEAMAAGAITVGRNTSGTKEQYDNGLNIIGKEIGFRFENSEDLAKILVEISNKTKKDFMTMIEDSQKVIKQLYTLEASSNNVLHFYNKILLKRGNIS